MVLPGIPIEPQEIFRASDAGRQAGVPVKPEPERLCEQYQGASLFEAPLVFVAIINQEPL